MRKTKNLMRIPDLIIIKSAALQYVYLSSLQAHVIDSDGAIWAAVRIQAKTRNLVKPDFVRAILVF
jgi:hypothetical protein